MKFGFVLPGGTARQLVEHAVLADEAGWDGVFVWEAAYGVDAWVLLGAMAERTTRVRLGTMLTPLPWRRPWKVASEVATLDQLSGGRAILSVGLGAVDTVLGNTGEVLDLRQRAAMLDDGIDLARTLWSGGLEFSSEHYDVELTGRDDLVEVLATGERPRPPIWVVGAWPRPKSMRRAQRCDGLLPVSMDDSGYRTTTPDDIRDMVAWLDANGGRPPGYDVVMEGETPADDPAQATEIVGPWADAGCTWWLDVRWELPHHSPERIRQVQERLEAGPPPLA